MTSNGHIPKPDRDPNSILFVPEAIRRMHAANPYERQLAREKAERKRQQELQRGGRSMTATSDNALAIVRARDGVSTRRVAELMGLSSQAAYGFLRALRASDLIESDFSSPLRWSLTLERRMAEAESIEEKRRLVFEMLLSEHEGAQFQIQHEWGVGSATEEIATDIADWRALYQDPKPQAEREAQQRRRREKA